LRAWSGSADAVVLLEFQHWLERKHAGAFENEYVYRVHYQAS
jgi:hypothetical protein